MGTSESAVAQWICVVAPTTLSILVSRLQESISEPSVALLCLCVALWCDSETGCPPLFRPQDPPIQAPISPGSALKYSQGKAPRLPGLTFNVPLISLGSIQVLTPQ